VVAVVKAVVVVASRYHTAEAPTGAVAVSTIDPVPHLDCVVFTVGNAGIVLIVAIVAFSVAA
jgi:hypothetical protein